jgi:hypothetical protein
MTDEKYYSVVDELNALRTENKQLTAIVEAYRLAGKYARLQPNGRYCAGEDCPLFLKACGKTPACLHPAEYEAEWLKAREGK